MTKNNYLTRFYDAVENYYHYNPDTLMPLMLVALAAKGKLHVSAGTGKPENAACVINPQEITAYDWVDNDTALKRRVNKWIKDGVSTIAVEMEIGRSLLPIFNTFKRNDEKDVVLEHHHRIGRLVNHSSNKAYEKAQRQYATLVLVEALMDLPFACLKNQYLDIFNYILERSGLQPKRPRLKVAHALNSLLQYDGKGVVYNPFAGCSIAGAMLQSKENYYGDGDVNDKLYAAGLLLNYGMGVSNEHFVQRDSTKWLAGRKIDYVLSTYIGYINGESAFDFCLGKCLEDPDFSGRYAGMVLPKEIFEKETRNFKEALKRDWIDSIVLLPFGEAAVLVNARKNDAQKGLIRFVDCTNPLVQGIPIEELFEDDMPFADIIKVRDVKKKGFLKSLVVSELPDREGYEKVRLGNIVSRITRKVYNLDKIDEEHRVLAYINRNEEYQAMPFPNENIERRPVNNLFSPVYFLDSECLVVNTAGNAEPRIFDAYFGSAFFEDGFAFSLNGNDESGWLINELNETYVRRQLHPYGMNKMVPEPLTEDDYLNLVLYRQVSEDYGFDFSDLEEPYEDNIPEQLPEEGADALPAGFELIDGNKHYSILNYIGKGSFGYTYRAEMHDRSNGKKEIVAIKEFYPRLGEFVCSRENNRVVYDCDLERSFNEYKEMFRSEPDFILSMADIPDNHVTEVKSIFESEITGTIYYVMKYYAGESLKDMIISGQVPSSEQLIVEKIIIPICKALNAMHSHRILHLDIKPDNIVIDENGEAIIIDFGVAHQYDEEGKLVSKRDTHSCSPFSAPENRDGNMRYFGPQADIFGAATTLFALVSRGDIPCPIEDEDDKLVALESMDCSDQMKLAIAEGMSLFSNDRPANAQQFLNLFPGCEKIKLG